jgi:ABC-2 type transport system permease protein
MERATKKAASSPLAALVWKLLRDVRLMLVAVAFLLAAFQGLWAKITERLIGQIVPMLSQLAAFGGLQVQAIEQEIFKGPGQFIRTLIGGERIDLQNAMDMLSIGYVHPLMQTIFCIWAIGRAAGAIAGEIDRGTMELLLAQPLARGRLVLAHLCVDALTIPLLCLSLWTGNWLGAWLITPIRMEQPHWKPGLVVQRGPVKIKVEDILKTAGPADISQDSERLSVRPAAFGKALWLVGGLIFGVSGATMWLSAVGRFRWRVLGVAVFVFLIQFLVNLVGQMWPAVAVLRPLTLFYYYQPQDAILGSSFDPKGLVLYGVGFVGYGLALWTFRRRDLPAPL